MTSLVKIAAIGFAAIGTAAAASVAWVNVSRASQTGQSRQAAGRPAPDGNGVIVCVAPDSVLRAVPIGHTCSSGQSSLPVRLVKNDLWDPPSVWDFDDSKQPNDSALPRPVPPDDPLADLQRRLSNLQRSPLFTVVDTRGDPIFEVAPETVLVYNANKTVVAAIRATADGGFFRVLSADGGVTTSVGASGRRAGVRVDEDGVRRLELGNQNSGAYSFKVLSLKPSGDPIAGIGQSRAGTGALIVGTVTGRVQATITVGDGKGMIGVSNDGGAAVLSLTEGATAGGLLAIGGARSEPMVKMGVNHDRYGVVLAGPVAGFPLVPRSGLPGSYFLGCAGGGACGPF